MEKAQQRLAALEREKAVLQGTTSLTASSVASTAAPNKAVEDSLRKDLQNQVCSIHCDTSTPLSIQKPFHLFVFHTRSCY